MHLVTFERPSGSNPTRDAVPPAWTTSMRNAALGLEALEEVTHGARRLGAALETGPHAGDIVDLNRALAIKLALDDAGAPEAEADSLLPPDARLFLNAWPDSLAAARTALAFTVDSLERYDAPDVLRAGIVEPARRARLCAPVPRPGKVIAVEHKPPLPGGARDPEPSFVLVAPSSVADPGGEIAIPDGVHRVDFGGGVAVVIGTSTRDVRVDEALACVAGYCAVNDVRAWDLFAGDTGPGAMGRSCDTFTPLGPSLVTADEVPDPQDLAIRVILSGEVFQSGGTKDRVWPVAELVARASHGMTLEPGDVLIAGTRGGSGAERQPPRWLRDGDVVEVEVERLGRLRSYVREGRSGT